MVDHAACDGNQGLGMLPSYLMDGLAAFLVAGVGDRAGVHDKDIGIAIAISDFISRRLEPRRQSIGFIEVHSAAQGFEGNFFHSLFIGLQNYNKLMI